MIGLLRIFECHERPSCNLSSQVSKCINFNLPFFQYVFCFFFHMIASCFMDVHVLLFSLRGDGEKK